MIPKKWNSPDTILQRPICFDRLAFEVLSGHSGVNSFFGFSILFQSLLGPLFFFLFLNSFSFFFLNFYLMVVDLSIYKLKENFNFGYNFLIQININLLIIFMSF